MKLVTVWLPEGHIQLLDSLVEKKRFASRADAIRVAIRDLVVDEVAMLRRMDHRRMLTELLEGVPYAKEHATEA